MLRLLVPHVERRTQHSYAHSSEKDLERMIAFACEIVSKLLPLSAKDIFTVIALHFQHSSRDIH